MTSPWGKIGAWAAEAERAEAEEREAAAAEAAAVAASGGDAQSYPSLRDSVSNKQTKKKKMSLQEFKMQGIGSDGGGGRGLNADEMLRLPTGPKERSAEEMQYGRLGGGFSSYGSGRSGGPPPGRFRDRDMEGDGSWGGNRRSSSGFDDDRRGPPPRVSDFDPPSRADEVDNWALGKKSLPQLDSGRPNRYGSLGGGGGGVGIGTGGISRADEVDNWGAGKKPMPVRSSNSGLGFRNSGPEPDRWTRGGGMGDGGNRERRRLVLDPPRGEAAVVEPVKTNRPSPFGDARPREEILAEKGLDWKKLDLEIEAKKTSRPTSSQSSRPGSAQSIRSEGAILQQGIEGEVKPRPKINPFGDAKPREVLLKEKGLDWRKIDLELDHRRIDRPETDIEKNLREEIEYLKKELEKEPASKANRESLQSSSEEQVSLQDIMLRKEKELEVLVCELDDAVRFGEKPIQRPGSGSGRGTTIPERLPSQPGAFNESRHAEFMERSRSRGTGDPWIRQGEDGRAAFGSRDRGFLSSRDLNRSRLRERW